MFCEQVAKLAKLGATDKEMADFFEVSEQTLNTWKKEHPEFLESLKEGKEKADAEVADRLYQRAMGYSHADVHISNYQGEVTLTPITKHYPPDPTSAIFWLKNRQRDKWRDKTDHEVTGKLEVEKVSDDELSRWLAFEAARSVISKAKENEPA